MRSHAVTLDFADPKQMLRFILGHVARISSAPLEFDKGTEKTSAYRIISPCNHVVNLQMFESVDIRV